MENENKKIIFKCITFALASIIMIVLFITTSSKSENKQNTQNYLLEESKDSFNTLTEALNSNSINSLNITYDEYGNPYYEVEQYEDFSY